jgi:hypothetical protein
LAYIRHQAFISEGRPIMEGMGKKLWRRRSFTPAFTAEIVELCQRWDRSVGQIAKDFDLTETAVLQGEAGRFAYPIIRLDGPMDVVAYVRALEESVIRIRVGLGLHAI